jgi:hypothetical protein
MANWPLLLEMATQEAHHQILNIDVDKLLRGGVLD